MVFEHSNEHGDLRVVRETFPTTNRSLMTATFESAAGDVVVHRCDSHTAEGSTALPGGVISLKTTSSNRRLLTVATRTGLEAGFPVELDGTLAGPGTVDELVALASPVLLGSAEVLTAIEAFALASGLPNGAVGAPLGVAGGNATYGAKDTIGCASAVVGLVASYFGLASCAATFGLGCAVALIAHTASVTGRVSCF